MATLTTQQITSSGLAPTYDAVATGSAGDKARPDARFIVLKAAVGGSITVTIAAAVACSHGSNHDRVVAVPAGTERLISLVPQERFTSLVDGLVALTYTGTTAGATIGAFRA